jgi:hypothetical protein
MCRLLPGVCKSAPLNTFVPCCAASFCQCTFCFLGLRCCVHFRDTNLRGNRTSIPLSGCGLWFSAEIVLFFLSVSSSSSCTLKGKKSIKGNDKSQPSDSPGQREHSVRMACHNDKEKAICSSRWVFYPLGVCNLKKVNYFFLVPFGIPEEVIYLIMSRHPAAMKAVISLAPAQRVLGSQSSWSLHKSPSPEAEMFWNIQGLHKWIGAGFVYFLVFLEGGWECDF